MRVPQLAGFGVTIAVVIGIDLPVDWLVAVATLAGGLATFVVSCAFAARR